MRTWLDKNTKWLFALPTAIFVVVCMGYPMCYAIYMSLHSWRMSLLSKPEFIGIKNYIELLTDKNVWNAIRFTFKYFVVSACFEVTLGVIIALMLSKIKKLQGFIRTVFIFPMVATPLAIGYVWRVMYDPVLGLFNAFLRFFGLETINWMGKEMVFTSLMVLEVWRGTPLIILIVLAGLTGISTEIYESARIDGANNLQQTFRITLPLLSPTIFMAFLLRGIELLKTYDVINAMTAGGPNRSTENLNLLVYSLGFQNMQMGEACALMIIFFSIVMTFALICMKMKKQVEERYTE